MWALIIPIIVLQFTPKQPAFLKPVIIYLILAFILNLFADVITDFKKVFHFPPWLQGNNPIYNLHSIVRLACFSYFFISLNQIHFKILKTVLPIISCLFVIVVFTFFDNFFLVAHLSGKLLTGEAYLLLIYCMLYYLSKLSNEDDFATNEPSFWVVTGLSIYVVTNFFVYLFYVPMIHASRSLSINMWNVHNVSYIILCLFLSKAFYANHRN